MSEELIIDGQLIPFQPGQTIMQAATAAGIYIPHLCYHPDLAPHGSCKLCNVYVNGRICSACSFPAASGQEVLNNTDELREQRRRIIQLLFVEGNHLCPGCEKTGACQLQALAYYLDMQDSHFPHFYPQRNVDASHPKIMIDFNRCVFCTLCVRASCELDGKNVFAIGGRGIDKKLLVNSTSGLLKDSDIETTDRAAQICPTGAILIKRSGYSVPIGERLFDSSKIDEVSLAAERGDHES